MDPTSVLKTCVAGVSHPSFWQKTVVQSRTLMYVVGIGTGSLCIFPLLHD
jgi:hypothetical protein